MGEFLILIGTFDHYPLWTVAAAVALVLTAIYGLSFYGRMVVKTSEIDGSLPLKDLTRLEIGLLCPLVLFSIVLGIYPQPLLNVSHQAITTTLKDVRERGRLNNSCTLARVKKLPLKEREAVHE
jgi:NADH-quinone oxidoreductase subunit M